VGELQPAVTESDVHASSLRHSENGSHPCSGSRAHATTATSP
jgi:hypothetical protein